MPQLLVRSLRLEVDRLCAEARAEGRLRSGRTDTDHPVGYGAFIADPDGNNLEVSFGQDVGLTVERSQSRPADKLGKQGV